MNANNLPFMRSLHNMARPHQFLRNNHPTGMAGAGISHQPVQPAVLSAGISPSAQFHSAHPSHSRPQVHFANGTGMGTVNDDPTLQQLSQVDVTQSYPYDHSWASQLPSTVTAGIMPSAPNMSAVGPDPGVTGPTPVSGDYLGMVGDRLGQRGDAQASEDMSQSAVPDGPRKFLGHTGRDWLNLGMNALSGLVGYNGQQAIAPRNPHGAQMAHSAQGAQGAMNYAQGGQIPQGIMPSQPAQPQAMPPQGMPGQQQASSDPNSDKQLILAAAAVISGQSDDQSVLQAFVQRFGQAELQHLAQMVQSGQLQIPQQGQQPQQMAPQGPQAPQAGLAQGGLVQGPGDGTSDSVPAVHAPTGHPIALSGEEYIVPSDAVSALGNGSSQAGARKIAAGIASIRRHKGAKTRSHPPNLSPNDNPLFNG